MFFVPGILISIITFPGIIVHELAHHLFCRWCRVAVFKVVYFQFANPVGYVFHEQPMYKYQSILISTGPFLINTILGIVIALPASLQWQKFDHSNPLDIILVYLGVSIAMHAFPSTGDAQNMWQSVMKDPKTNPLLKAIVAPIVGLIYIGAAGSMIWLDFIYGLAVTLWLPSWLIERFA